MSNRYDALYNSLRGKYGLNETDVPNAKMSELFDKVLETYSRFRGQRNVQIINYATDTLDYNLDSTVFHIIKVYWNDTYPSEFTAAIESESMASERYHNPALKMIDAYKKRMQAQLAAENLQDWDDFDTAGGVHQIHVNVQPETNILVEHRELFTKANYPRTDEGLIGDMLEAAMLRFILGVPQLMAQGDLRFNIDGMTKIINSLESDFYRTVRTVKIGRT